MVPVGSFSRISECRTRRSAHPVSELRNCGSSNVWPPGAITVRIAKHLHCVTSSANLIVYRQRSYPRTSMGSRRPAPLRHSVMSLCWLSPQWVLQSVTRRSRRNPVLRRSHRDGHPSKPSAQLFHCKFQLSHSLARALCSFFPVSSRSSRGCCHILCLHLCNYIL